MQILVSYSQAGPGRKAKQGQEEISRNHVQTFFLVSVCFAENEYVLVENVALEERSWARKKNWSAVVVGGGKVK